MHGLPDRQSTICMLSSGEGGGGCRMGILVGKVGVQFSCKRQANVWNGSIECHQIPVVKLAMFQLLDLLLIGSFLSFAGKARGQISDGLSWKGWPNIKYLHSDVCIPRRVCFTIEVSFFVGVLCLHASSERTARWLSFNTVVYCSQEMCCYIFDLTLSQRWESIIKTTYWGYAPLWIDSNKHRLLVNVLYARHKLLSECSLL